MCRTILDTLCLGFRIDLLYFWPGASYFNVLPSEVWTRTIAGVSRPQNVLKSPIETRPRQKPEPKNSSASSDSDRTPRLPGQPAASKLDASSIVFVNGTRDWDGIGNPPPKNTENVGCYRWIPAQRLKGSTLFNNRVSCQASTNI